MYLDSEGSRLALLGQKVNYGPSAWLAAASNLVVAGNQQVMLDVYGVADGASPVAQHHIEIDGSLLGSRRIGNTLYVASNWTPNLASYMAPAGSTAEQRQAAAATLTAAALAPKVRVDGGTAQPLLSESDCYVQPGNASQALQLTTITAFDLASGGVQRNSRCFAGDSNTLYMSRDNVYLASSRQVWIAAALSGTVFPAETTTDIHKLALSGQQIAYRGSGQVAGHLGWDGEKMPYRMSEYNGDLRVLSYTGTTGWVGVPTTGATPPAAPSPATLTVLREDSAAGKLVTVGKLPNSSNPQPIGHEGEQVYAVQFAGERAYVVTFRRTDPLYVLDLSSAADPRAVGELAMPGYSDYLFPLADGRLLGVGRDASATALVAGIKVALFDVSRPAQPALLASRTLGGSGSMSALDYSRHGINLFMQGSKVRVALPVLVSAASNGTSQAAYQGLARWDVDTVAGTLADLPVAVTTRFDGTAADADRWWRYPLWNERSVQSAAAAYYLTGGQVVVVRD
jgi:hypothetical protein